MKAFDVPFTIIRPNYFYQNDERLKDAMMGAGMYPMPLGPAASRRWTRGISPRRRGALMTEGHYGKTYNLNGPEVLSGPRVASIWGDLLGKPVAYPGRTWTVRGADAEAGSPGRRSTSG